MDKQKDIQQQRDARVLQSINRAQTLEKKAAAERQRRDYVRQKQRTFRNRWDKITEPIILSWHKGNVHGGLKISNWFAQVLFFLFVAGIPVLIGLAVHYSNVRLDLISQREQLLQTQKLLVTAVEEFKAVQTPSGSGFSEDISRALGEAEPLSRLSEIETLIAQTQLLVDDQPAEAGSDEVFTDYQTLTRSLLAKDTQVRMLNTQIQDLEQKSHAQLAQIESSQIQAEALKTSLTKANDTLAQMVEKYARSQEENIQLATTIRNTRDLMAYASDSQVDLEGNPQEDLVSLASISEQFLINQGLISNATTMIDQQATSEIQSMLLVMDSVGIDPDRIARQVPSLTMMGGPVSDAAIEEIAQEPHLVDKLERIREQQALLQKKLSTKGELAEFLTCVPLGRPLESYRVTSPFGDRNHPILNSFQTHRGLDMGARTGSKVRTMSAGEVYRAGRYRGFGLMIEIRHPCGFITRYAHLSEILVKKGQKVNTLDIIAKVGNTGLSTGPHLHYEIMYNGEYYDPYLFVVAGDDIVRTKPNS